MNALNRLILNFLNISLLTVGLLIVSLLTSCSGNKKSNKGNNQESNQVGSPSASVSDDIDVHISLGYDHTCALKNEGSVFCWGYDSKKYGSLGHNGAGDSDHPVAVVGVDTNNDGNGDGLLTEITQISAGEQHTCALKSDGGVLCWGYWEDGQLGNNGVEDTDHPGAVVGEDTNSDGKGDGLLTGITQISAGSEYTCALKNDGSVLCWGYNGHGQLGRNTGSANPTAVIGEDTNGDDSSDGLLTGITQISAGDIHTCALKSDGGVLCWGYQGIGRLGNNSRARTGQNHPVAVVGEDINGDNDGDGLLTGITQISSGVQHTCALKNNGGVLCWGEGTNGRLGNNGTGDKYHPVAVVGEDTNGDSNGDGLLTGITQISAGNKHTCALKSDGGVLCWGEGANGRLGNNGTGDKYHPVAVVGEDTNGDGNGKLTGIIQISAGYKHTCAVKNNGEVLCWGSEEYGRLGNDSTTGEKRPSRNS